MNIEHLQGAVESVDKAIEDLKPKFNDAMAKANAIGQNIDLHRKYRRELIQGASKYAPYKIGDKVTVHNCYLEGPAEYQDWQPRDGAISKVIVVYRNNGEVDFEYKINRLNKDGSMHKKAAIRYNTDIYEASEFSKTTTND